MSKVRHNQTCVNNTKHFINYLYYLCYLSFVTTPTRFVKSLKNNKKLKREDYPISKLIIN